MRDQFVRSPEFRLAMERRRAPIFGLYFAILTAACSSPSTGGNPGTAGTGATGTGGTISCGSDQTLCGSQCLNTTADSDNCGGCGIPCLGGHTCQASQCKCPAGMLDCN